ncbi:MAG: hypothetical protein OQL27_05570, partial [Sedimenticola sp.]|nr:hypothetical protein [Sedimenticola sp.]
ALAGLLHKINDAGGYIATVVSPVSQMDSPQRVAVVRYIADEPEALDKHLQEIGYEVITELLPKS